ncbi:hypothetical protein [Streptomyces sp. NPDC000410]|uniref:hypothetical protein n=1 Tax=Streptomyces sp. NPDC000410 TaxID=3154254 RepID=UPI003326962A
MSEGEFYFCVALFLLALVTLAVLAAAVLIPSYRGSTAPPVDAGRATSYTCSCWAAEVRVYIPATRERRARPVGGRHRQRRRSSAARAPRRLPGRGRGGGSGIAPCRLALAA